MTENSDSPPEITPQEPDSPEHFSLGEPPPPAVAPYPEGQPGTSIIDGTPFCVPNMKEGREGTDDDDGNGRSPGNDVNLVGRRKNIIDLLREGNAVREVVNFWNKTLYPRQDIFTLANRGNTSKLTEEGEMAMRRLESYCSINPISPREIIDILKCQRIL